MPVLSKIFGECNQVKILEMFAENPNKLLYVADIVKLTGISKITVNSHVNKLLDEGIIEKGEKDGRVQFYKLNINNSKAKIIRLLEQYISSENLGALIPDEIKKSTDHMNIDTTISIKVGSDKDNCGGVNTQHFETPSYPGTSETKIETDANKLKGETNNE